MAPHNHSHNADDGQCESPCFPKQSCTEGVCTGAGVLSADQLKEALKSKDFLLINVRVPQIGIIPGTDASISHTQVDRLARAIGEDLDRKVVLYCGKSNRIKFALKGLQERGYRSISTLDGGVTAWRKAGFPLE